MYDTRYKQFLGRRHLILKWIVFTATKEIAYLMLLDNALYYLGDEDFYRNERTIDTMDVLKYSPCMILSKHDTTASKNRQEYFHVSTNASCRDSDVLA